ncbi:MAG: hypothetical protein ACO3EZ_16370 [Prochlorotrichaceae cyanobacterium]
MTLPDNKSGSLKLNGYRVGFVFVYYEFKVIAESTGPGRDDIADIERESS